MNYRFIRLFTLIVFCLFAVCPTEAYYSQEDASFYLNRGIRNHKRHYIEEAIIDYNQALQLEPQSAVVYYNRGLAKSEIKDLQGALYDFNMSLRLDPQNDSAYFNRGIVKYELGDFRGALMDYNRTIEMVPGDAKAYYNRAITKYAIGDLGGSLRDAAESKRLFKALRKRREFIEVAQFMDMIKSQNQYYPR